MKFSEISYSRPDTEAVKAEMERLTAALRSAVSFVEADELFLAMEKLTAGFDTMQTVASIRHDIDTRDEFYDGEQSFFDAVSPELEEYCQNWNRALLESPYRQDFAEKYNPVFLLNTEISLRTFSPEIIPEMQQENALCSEYAKLLASAQIPFEGETYTIAQIGPFKQDPDDERRLAAWKAEAGFYKENQERLDGIYDELVQLRTAMGRKLGCENYTQLGYWRMGRNCYDRGDVEKFREAVVKYVVPVASDIYRRQAERLEKSYPLSFADAALSFRSGNPKPCGAPDEILAEGRAFYHDLSPETAEFIDVMLDSELMDVLSRPGKAGGGYCTNLADFRLPFIFANFNGTSDDVETVTHEAGHAFADYMSRNVIPAESCWPSMEACEVHSMSMEFFAWAWADRFYGEDARKFRYSHLSGALTFIPYGTMVDHFQHIVYDQPELTPAGRHAVWKELLGIYMPWMKLDGDIPFYSEGEGWQRQHHIYELPFYYIDYCLAQTMSLQFWELIQEDKASAWERYMAYTRPGGTKTFTDLIAGAGLLSPFDGECLRRVCEKAAVWLEQYDMTGIV